ncbi:MAG: hypothetical protein DIJKHBIC_00564 [Thermoanaerobaculia bacterium]|nr:hypothetical protein [Thermoanaerobaculia bacterium]
MKKTLATNLAITVFGAAVFGAAALTLSAAPYPQSGDDVTKVTTVERTILLRSADGAQPIVLKVPDLKDGETRIIAAEDGRQLKVTRKGKELTVNTGEKDIKVVLPDENAAISATGQKMVVVKAHEEAGKPGEVTKKVIIMKDHNVGPGEPVSAPKLLQNAQLKSYDRLDPKTRSAVDEVVQELIDKGTVIAPGIWIDSLKGDNVRVEVRKDEKKN